jgi:hypothetical protein
MRKCLLFVLFALLIAGTAYGDFVYEKTQDTGARCRGMAIYDEDDAFVGIATTPYSMQWYHAMDQGAGLYDCARTTFVKAIGDTLTYSYNWGAGIHDGLVYHSVQIPSEPNTYILVWDHDCGEVDYLSTGVDPSGSEYPTAVDCDADGNVYIAWYIDSNDNDPPHQISVYPPRTSWVAHTATKLSETETFAYVCEGMCVTQDGSTIYATNRSSPGTNGWCKKFDGSPTTGYTEDVGFLVSVDGYVRACDVDETNGRVFVANDGGAPSDGCIFVCDASTGAIQDTIICLDLGTYHNSPYDIEWDEDGQDLYVQHRYGWYIDKYHWEPPTAVTMSSFEAHAGEGMVDLIWRVESERDNAGFRIIRDSEEIAFVESQGNSEAPRTYSWVDHEVTAGVTYTYKIRSVGLDGSEEEHFTATATPTAATVPTAYSLAQNYPNPFNADTQIEFTLAKPGYTTLKIYNTTGQLVRTLVDSHLDARMHKVRWDGRNNNNELVSSGIYFYRLASGTFAETKKMSFLR